MRPRGEVALHHGIVDRLPGGSLVLQGNFAFKGVAESRRHETAQAMRQQQRTKHQAQRQRRDAGQHHQQAAGGIVGARADLVLEPARRQRSLRGA